MSKMICGIVVDEEFYKEFMERDFKILDKTVKANVVEIYATSRDFATNAPEYTKAAQKVREQIRAEIQSYYAAKDGRKEYKAMKHQNFGEYILDLKPIFDKASKRREELLKDKERAEKKWAELGKDKAKVGELQYSKAYTAFLEAQKLYTDRCKELEEETNIEVKTLRNSFHEHLVDFYTPNGARIDNDVVNLLNSGIKLKGEEVDSLIMRNANNPTMLRIIADFTEKAKIKDSSLAISMRSMARAKGMNELKVFDSVAHTINALVAGNDMSAKVWTSDKNRERFCGYADDGAAELDRLIVKPNMQVSGE